MVAPGSVACSTVVFSVVMTLTSWVCSLPRTMDMLSRLAFASAFFTFVSVVLATIFSVVEEHPAGFHRQSLFTDAQGASHVGGDPIVTAFPVDGTSFVSGMTAFLSISCTFIGQFALPSFIAEMRDPR